MYILSSVDMEINFPAESVVKMNYLSPSNLPAPTLGSNGRPLTLDVKFAEKVGQLLYDHQIQNTFDWNIGPRNFDCCYFSH